MITVMESSWKVQLGAKSARDEDCKWSVMWEVTTMVHYAILLRNDFNKYFNPDAGALPWQIRHVRRGQEADTED